MRASLGCPTEAYTPPPKAELQFYSVLSDPTPFFSEGEGAPIMETVFHESSGNVQIKMSWWEWKYFNGCHWGDVLTVKNTSLSERPWTITQPRELNASPSWVWQHTPLG